MATGGRLRSRLVPTAKRERQRAARRARQAAVQAKKRRARLLRRGGLGLVIALAAVAIIYFVSRSPANGCPATNGSSAKKTSFTKAPPMCISTSKTYTATVTTDVGTFDISLDTKASPTTVNDFVYLALYHFYDGLTFHRVIPGFVVQGGDPNPPTKSNPSGNGAQGPGYSVAGEVPKAGSYKLGTVAMAKTSSQPSGTAGSQFFIVVGKQGESLPPQYSILGKVTSGMSVVNKIAAGGTTSGQPKVLHKIISVTISS